MLKLALTMFVIFLLTRRKPPGLIPPTSNVRASQPNHTFPSGHRSFRLSQKNQPPVVAVRMARESRSFVKNPLDNDIN